MISKEICAQVLQKALSTGGDFAEMFVERTVNHSIHMVKNQVDSISDKVISGAAVRVYKGLRSVMTTTIDKSPEGLLLCAEKAAEALGQGDAAVEIVLRQTPAIDLHPYSVDPRQVGNREKIELLKAGYFAAAEYHEAVRQVTGSFADVDKHILIANSQGLYVQDRTVRNRLSISAVAEVNGQTQTGGHDAGRRMGLEMFDTIDPAGIGREAARKAVTMAGADYCPAMVMPVAIEKGFGGVIFHEACGHSLEAAFVAYGRSQFMDKLGQQIANPKLTAIDDGTIPNAWGSMNTDDEGTPARKNVLIEKGVLRSYMIDRFNGRRMGMPSTGNARRQSYCHTPTARMTNTYIAPGEDRNEDIIGSIEYGLYAKEMGGGSVNPVTGEFNFAVSEGYLIRNGQICEPVRGASLVGKGSEVLHKIDMVGTELALGQGICGASSGHIPTNVGQPLIRVSSITVGGR